MSARRTAVSVGICALIWAALSISALPQDTKSRIKAEISRLQRSLKDEPVKDQDFAPIASAAESSLQAALDQLNAGRPYLSLEQLALGADYFQAARIAAAKEEIVKGGFPAYQAKWNKTNLNLTELDRKSAQRDWAHAPSVVRALSETAQGRSLPLLEGGLGFATATAPQDGLAYLGQAQGEAQFAEFCVSLNFPAPPTATPLRSMLPELIALQQKTNAAFQPPRSIDLHPRFIALNSAIKLAEELDQRRFYAGSLYQYLEAVRHYGMLDAPPVDVGKQAALKQAVAREQENLASSATDLSIAQLFIERAASYVSHADGSATTPDEWRSAQVIVDQVLPAYFAAQKAPAAMPASAGKTVTLTLVRWPYT